METSDVDDIFFVEQKKKGFRRSSQKQKAKENFTCKKCDAILESKELMDSHI